MPALTFGLAGDRCGGRTFSLSAAASNRGGSRGPCSSDETVEVAGDPAVWEDHCRFGQDLFFGVSAGNVVEDKLLYVAFERERSRFRRGEMAVVACHLRISIEKPSPRSPTRRHCSVWTTHPWFQCRRRRRAFWPWRADRGRPPDRSSCRPPASLAFPRPPLCVPVRPGRREPTGGPAKDAGVLGSRMRNRSCRCRGGEQESSRW